MEEHDTENGKRDILHPESASGFWVMQDPEPTRVWVTSTPNGMIAILLDQLLGQEPFELLDLGKEHHAVFLGEVLLDQLAMRTGSDYVGVSGRMLVSDGISYLTCVVDGKLTLIEIENAEWKDWPDDGNLAASWRLLAIYNGPYLANVYERPDAGASLVW